MYAQVTQLFNTAPDLLEDFKQFLPESAAHAKQQQQARLAEEAAPISSMRGDPMALPSQAPNRDVKNMPPMGSFHTGKDAGKESKKRRGPPGAGGSSVSGPAGLDGARLPDSQARNQSAQFSNVNKVCVLAQTTSFHHDTPAPVSTFTTLIIPSLLPHVAY